MNIEDCTIHITDPRKLKNQKHSFESLLLIIFSSVISGYDTPDTMVEFSKLKFKWLNLHANMSSVPCAETLRYFIACIKPDELIKGFEAFVSSSTPSTKDIISIDGKTMRGTKHGAFDALHLVSAWSQEQGITLAALESEGKSNEIKTIPKLLDCLNIEDAIITTDAMGCQRDIADKIQQGKGDYVLQLKDNQKNFLKEIKAYHHKLEREGYGKVKHELFEEIDKGHGRLEIRKYQHLELSSWVEHAKSWQGARSIVRVERTRITKNGESQEVSWYLSSLEVDANQAAKAVRGHWEVENKLHWRLDVIFKEDEYCSQSCALTMGLLKRFCMNLLILNDGNKRRMKHKVMAAAIDDDYRSKVLFTG